MVLAPLILGCVRAPVDAKDTAVVDSGEARDTADTGDTEDSTDTGDTSDDGIYVCPDVGQYSTITEALAATVSESGLVELLLCPAWFKEAVDVSARRVSIVSIAGGNTTWIDAQRDGSVFTGDEQTQLMLRGVSLMNGELWAVDLQGGTVQIEDSWITESPGAVSAGTVFLGDTLVYDTTSFSVSGESVVIEGSRIEGAPFNVESLDLNRVLWIGSGNLNTADVRNLSNVTLVQNGEGSVNGGSVGNSIFVGAWSGTSVPTFSDVWGGTLTLGGGSFSADPMFAGDYALAEGSPCIDSGAGVDADGSVADLGWTGGT